MTPTFDVGVVVEGAGTEVEVEVARVVLLVTEEAAVAEVAADGGSDDKTMAAVVVALVKTADVAGVVELPEVLEETPEPARMVNSGE